MNSSLTPSRLGVALALLGLAALTASGLNAQENNQRGKNNEQRGKSQQLSSQGQLSIPADGIVRMEVLAPDQVRVGQSFDYEIVLSNNSDNIAVHDLKIVQSGSDRFQIESSRFSQRDKPGDAQSGKSKDKRRPNRNRKPNRNQKAKDRKSNDQDASNQSESSDESGSDVSEVRDSQSSQSQTGQRGQSGQWTIQELMPGETRRIHVQAASDAEGEAKKMCIAIASYTTALCIETDFVKPELEIVKRQIDADGEPVSKDANLCQPVYFGYFIKNTGTGSTGPIEVSEDFANGLTTTNGEQSVSFTIDNLQAGETKGFKVTLNAHQTGQYDGRAVAMMKKTEKEVRSNNAGVKVVVPQLDIALEGDEVGYASDLMTYTIRLTNNGDVPAVRTQLKFKYSQALQLAQAGGIRSSDKAVSSGSSSDSEQSVSTTSEPNNSDAKQKDSDRESEKSASDTQDRNESASTNSPTLAELPGDMGETSQSGQKSNQRDKKQKQKQKQSQDDASDDEGSQGQDDAQDNRNRGNRNRGNNRQGSKDRQMANESWNVGTLEPGETVSVSFSLRGSGDDAGSYQLHAMANSLCGEDKQGDENQLTASAAMQTEVIALPALQIIAYDDEDPTPLGKEVVYTIRVTNEGQATDENIQIEAEIPNGMTFVKADGETEVNSQGPAVTFEPVKKLEPGERVVWTVTAKADQPGDKIFRANLRSDALSRTTSAEEPTRLYKD